MCQVARHKNGVLKMKMVVRGMGSCVLLVNNFRNGFTIL